MKKQLLISFCILMFCFENVRAQDGTITGLGTVNKDNLPIPRISVKIKGSNNKIAPYPKGRNSFTISGLSTLQFSFLAYTTQDVITREATFSKINLFKID
jgi:hypothetical protein